MDVSKRSFIDIGVVVVVVVVELKDVFKKIYSTLSLLLLEWCVLVKKHYLANWKQCSKAKI